MRATVEESKGRDAGGSIVLGVSCSGFEAVSPMKARQFAKSIIAASYKAQEKAFRLRCGGQRSGYIGRKVLRKKKV